MTTEPVNEVIVPDGAPAWKRRVAVTTISLVVALLVAEAALWLADQPRFPRPHTFPPQFMLVGEPDAEGWIRHVNKPTTTIPFRYESDPRGYFGSDRTVVHTTNSLGFRGGEFPLVETRDGRIEAIGEKPDGVLRIVFLGDSVTFGEGVHDADTFVERVGRRLSAGPTRRLEVFNFGVGGHNTSDALWVWQRFARRLDPDLVVYTFVLNDAEPRLFQLDRSTREPVRVPRRIESKRARWTGRPDTWWSGSRLASLFWKAWSSRKLDAATLSYFRELNASDSPHWTRCRQSLTALQQIDTPLAVVVFPLLHDLAAHPFRQVHFDLAETCRDAEVIDLWEPLSRRAGNDTPSLWVDPADTHPNEIAHAVAARVIVERLERLLSNPGSAPRSVP